MLRQASDYVAGRLLREGTEMWSRDPQLVGKAIDKVERAWALSRDPAIAIQLATLYDRANRNDDALVVLCEAFRKCPQDALLRHHAAITLLRHGAPSDIRDFFDSVLKLDADDAFARFIMALLDRYDDWVGQLASSIEAKRDGRQPFLMSLPVWGQPYSAYFVRYLCAALLSPNNLPALAARHSVHIAIFTTEETEKALHAEPLFCRLAEHATVNFVHYAADLVNYGASMKAAYGDHKVPFSENSLAFYYQRNCKFALMSAAHYVALAAGRATDALVSCLVADMALNDGALPLMAAHMDEADAVLLHSVQLHGKIVRPILDQEYRSSDGILQIPSDGCAKLVVEHLPAGNFADARLYLDPPLRIAWRVGKDGVLVHGNHYHPICLRPKAFAHPLRLSIDPIDSRFIDRTSLDMSRLYFVRDASIVGLSIDDDPILEPSENSMGTLSVPLFALWLWGYWGRLRGALFRTTIRLGPSTVPEAWQRAEAEAAPVVDAIVTQAARLEDGNRAAKSWRL
jgi:hypothetical protein